MGAIWDKTYPQLPPFDFPSFFRKAIPSQNLQELNPSVLNPSRQEPSSLVPNPAKPVPFVLTATRESDIKARIQPYVDMAMGKEEIKKIAADGGITEEEFDLVWRPELKERHIQPTKPEIDPVPPQNLQEPHPAKPVPIVLTAARQSDIEAGIQLYLQMEMQKEEIKKIAAEDGITEEEFNFVYPQLKDELVKEIQAQPANPLVLPIKYEGLPGEWYLMVTSQVKEKAPNACTSIALFTLNKLLANQKDFSPHQFFNPCIVEGSQKHLEKYGISPLNRLVKEVIQDLDLNHLKTIHEITYDPALVGVLEEAPQTTRELTEKVIKKSQGKPFGATLSDGRETIALYYKSNQEMYILDSHQKTFEGKNQQIHLDTAYIVKLNSKVELDDFLFKQRYFFDEQAQADIDQGLGMGGMNGANQIDVTMFH